MAETDAVAMVRKHYAKAEAIAMTWLEKAKAYGKKKLTHSCAIMTTSKFRVKIRKEYESFSYGVFEDIDATCVLTNFAREAPKTSGLVNNLSNWTGLQFLLWDAQMRAGISY